MAYLPLRAIPDRATKSVAEEWLGSIADALDDSATDRSTLCRQVLCDLTFPEYSREWETAVRDPKLASGTRLGLSALDPRHVTLEPEYYSDCDDARFQRVKPLLWLWYSFDRTTLGGQNVWLGV